MEKERFSGMFMDWVMTFLVVAILATVCNIVGYDGGFIESLPGMLIFGLISLAGLTVKHFVPGNLPAVAYIALIGMIVAMPFSPISGFVVYWAGKVSLMATVTPILAYAGVIVGRSAGRGSWYPCWLSLVRSWSPEESHRFSETFCKREK